MSDPDVPFESVRRSANTSKIMETVAMPNSVELPIAMIMFCPMCKARHIDKGIWETKLHHTHACQHCGFVWRPAIVATVGVAYLPGFKNV